MSVHKRANNDTYYVAYRDADGRQHTKTFGKGREGKRDAQRFDEEIKARKLIETPLPVFAPGQKAYIDQLTQLYINAKKAEGKSLRWIKELAVLVMSATAPMSPLSAQLMEPRSARLMEPFGDQAMEPFRDHLMEPGQR